MRVPHSLIVRVGMAAAVAVVWCLAIPLQTLAEPPEVEPATAAEAKPAAEKELAGVWQGTLKVGVELRLVFHVEQGEDGEYRAKLDSLDQGATGIPVAQVTRDGDGVVLDVKRIGGSYSGTLADDGDTIRGHWSQGGREFPLELARLEKPPEIRRPQDPQPPYPYREEEVVFQNEVAGIKLAGTLTSPESDSPVPAVVLISGSGPQDRNETVMGHRPFLVLADYLTRRGVAVLRFDDRGVGGSEGDTLSCTTAEVADDALAAVDFLKSQREVDPGRIGLIGHSEGGLVAPLAASRSRDVAFIVLMAGTGVPGDEILYRQGELIARADGADDETVAKVRAQQERLLVLLKEETDEQKLGERLRAVLTEKSADPANGEEPGPVEVASAAKFMQSRWFRYFVSYDPRPALRQVRCPVLAINGEKDLQVDPQQNIPQIEQALAEADNQDCTFHVFRGLNHLFQTCTTGSPAEYGKIEQTLSPEVLKFVADWIAERVK